MSTTITRGDVVLTPDAVTNFTSERESRNVVHNTRPDPDVTIRRASLRTGSLELAYTSPSAETDSAAAEQAHAASGVFSIVSPGRPTLEFSYVTNGRIARRPDPSGAWLVTVDYQEVLS